MSTKSKTNINQQTATKNNKKMKNNKKIKTMENITPTVDCCPRNG